MKKGFSFITIMALVVSLVACTAPNTEGGKAMKDRAGFDIVVPEKIETIITMAPSLTWVVSELGAGDKIIAIDKFSADVPGIKQGVPQIDIMSPDAETLISLKPDILFVSGMSSFGGEDPFKLVKDSGICVVNIPSSESIEAIAEDEKFIAQILGLEQKGLELIDNMNAEIEKIRAVGQTIEDKKSVYFEIGSTPELYSFGKGVFLDEMITLIGANNILAEQKSWVSVSDEFVVQANPDVILTNINYVEDAIGDIVKRKGFQTITAVKEGEVYYIDNVASSLPNHNIVKALREMAIAIYPDEYK